MNYAFKQRTQEKNYIMKDEKDNKVVNIREENGLINYNNDVQVVNNGDSPSNKSPKRIIEIIGLVMALVCAFGSFMYTWGTINGRIGPLEDNVRGVKDSQEKTNEKISNISEAIASLTRDIEWIKRSVDTLESDAKAYKNSYNAAVCIPQTNLIKGISVNPQTTEFLSAPTWGQRDIIAKNFYTGKKYKAKDLMNKKILIPYKDDGQDAYFFGQFNKQNHWDGDCLINLYDKKRKLTMIMEGRYSDGDLLSYRQVGYYKNHSKQWVWNVSKRETKGSINTGETYTYYKNKNKKAAFTKKTVEASDIMSVADFKEWITGAMEGYYYGNTQNGAYNDNTGKAYLIKYDKGKKVRTLYCGKFKNGAFHDESGNAWYISYDAENSTYIYFKGKFVNNKPVETSTHKRENISLNEIHQIMKGKHFNESVDLHER